MEETGEGRGIDCRSIQPHQPPLTSRAGGRSIRRGHAAYVRDKLRMTALAHKGREAAPAKRATKIHSSTGTITRRKNYARHLPKPTYVLLLHT